MKFDQRDEIGFTVMQTAMDARDRDREKVVIEKLYRQRSEAVMRELCRNDFPPY